jgi:hypothetical protein
MLTTSQAQDRLHAGNKVFVKFVDVTSETFIAPARIILGDNITYVPYDNGTGFLYVHGSRVLGFAATPGELDKRTHSDKEL